MDNNQETAPEAEEATGQAEPQAAESQESDTGEELIAGKFKSQEDLEKAYSEAQKQLTQVSQKAKRADELESSNKKLNTLVGKIADEQGVSVDTVLSALNEEVGEETNTVEDELKSIKAELAETRLLSSNPELKENLDLIKSIAKGEGISLEEALQSDSVKRVLELSQKSSTPSVVESTNKLSRSDAGHSKKLERIRQGDTELAAKMLLGIKD